MAQENPFDQFDSAPAKPKPLRGPPPDQTKVAGEKRDEIRTTLALKGDARDDRNEQRNIDKDRRDTEIKLRSDFAADPEVKSYRAAMPIVSSALRPRKKSGQTDLTLIYAYAKLMDPTTGVREGEMANAQNTSPWAQSKIQTLQNQLDGSGNLPPEVKRGLEQEIIGNARQRRKAYEARRAQFSADAEAYGLDPVRVVGQHDGDPFRADMQEYDKAHSLGRFAEKAADNGGDGGTSPDGGGLRLPELRGGIPTNMINGDTGRIDWGGGPVMEGAPFDYYGYVQDQYKLDRSQHDWVVGFWTANIGNPNISPEAVKAAYQRAGIPADSPLYGDAYIQQMATAANSEDALKSGMFGSFDVSEARAKREAELQSVADAVAQRDGSANAEGKFDPNSAGAYKNRAASGALMNFNDELSGVGGFVANSLMGENPIEGYKLARDAERYRDYKMNEAQGLTGHAVEFLGSLPTAALGGEANTVAQIAKTGAKFGTVAGFGQGEGLTGSVTGAGVGGVLGGALGAGMAKAAPKVASGVKAMFSKEAKTAPLVDDAVIAAGERQGIPIRQPDAVPSLRNEMATAEASPYGGQMIDDALKGDAQAVQAKLSEVGGKGQSMAGDSMNYQLGQRGRKVAEDYIERTRVKKNDLYGEAEQLAAGQRVVPEEAIAAVNRNIAELEAAGANTNSAQIGYLKGLRDDLSKADGFSITEFQGLRSSASGKIKGDQALTASDADRRLGDIVKAFTADAENQLPGQAATKLAEADKFYAERMDYINNTLKQIIGTRRNPASPEDVGKRLVAMTKTRADHDRLASVLREADKQTRDDFAATIAENLGAGPNGEFGLGALASNINKMPQNIRTLVFGKEGNAALNDLQAIARAKSDTAGGLNRSKSGVVMMRDLLKRSMIGMTGGGATGAAAGGVPGALVGGVAVPMMTEMVAAIGQRRAAKLLLSTDFTKLIRQAPKTATPKQAKDFLGKMTAVLAGNPETAGMVDNVVPLFKSRIDAAFGNSATAAAANDQEQQGRRKPVGQ